MSSDIDHLANLPPEQRRIRHKCYHPTGVFRPFPKAAIEQSIPERFAAMVRLYPQRLALKDGHIALTYEALNQRANRVAQLLLRRYGRGKEPVALLFDQAWLGIVALLGVLKSGKIYVPLDPSFPLARTAYMLRDAQAIALLTSGRQHSVAQQIAAATLPVLSIDGLEADEDAEPPRQVLSPDDLAYIIYTSGSTGNPKGVVQNHRNVLHHLMTFITALHICPEDRISLLHAMGSSAARLDIFGALLSGATLCSYDATAANMGAVSSWLSREALTIYHWIPTAFRHASRMLSGEAFPALRLIVLGSESVDKRDVELYQKHFSTHCMFVNRLGTSESGNVRMYFMDKQTPTTQQIVPVGYPVEDMELLLHNERGERVGVDEVGEIVIRSAYLAPGYWRQPVLTQAAFVADETAGQRRLYRTGDLGRMRADGCLEHLGRKDFQVKIRGHRIEVSEIEQALLYLEAVQEAVVVTRDDRCMEQRLIAYVVPKVSHSVTVSDLASALRSRLPAHMVPSTFVLLDALPLTPNGKLNRLALPAANRARPVMDRPFGPPRTPLEATLVTLWSEVLDVEQIGIHDPFLDLGGHSLLGMRLLSRIVETFRLDLPVHTLWEAPTIAEMALVITQHQANQATPATISRLLAEVEAMDG